jgi:hypothetical protein
MARENARDCTDIAPFSSTGSSRTANPSRVTDRRFPSAPPLALLTAIAIFGCQARSSHPVGAQAGLISIGAASLAEVAVSQAPAYWGALSGGGFRLVPLSTSRSSV